LIQVNPGPDRLTYKIGKFPNREAEMAALRANDDDLLCVRMHALRLDKAEVARLWPSIVLDLQTSCAACGSRAQCDEDLKSLSPEGEGLEHAEFAVSRCAAGYRSRGQLTKAGRHSSSGEAEHA
jgi:hypothetical protein